MSHWFGMACRRTLTICGDTPENDRKCKLIEHLDDYANDGDVSTTSARHHAQRPRLRLGARDDAAMHQACIGSVIEEPCAMSSSHTVVANTAATNIHAINRSGSDRISLEMVAVLDTSTARHGVQHGVYAKPTAHLRCSWQRAHGLGTIFS